MLLATPHRDHQTALDLQARHSQWDHQRDQELLQGQHESPMSCRVERLEAIRQRFLDRFNRTETGRDSGRYEAPRNGDLVLLRRAALGNRRDKKLEPRWEGPFRLDDVAHHGRSGHLFDLSTGQLVKTKISGLRDRVHLDDLRCLCQEGKTRVRGRFRAWKWTGTGGDSWAAVSGTKFVWEDRFVLGNC